MKPERLAEIRAREQAATEGPWDTDHHEIRAGGGTEYDFTMVTSAAELIARSERYDEYDWYGNDENADANFYFIAHARQDIPALLDEVEALASDNATMRDGLARLECRVLQELVAAQPENKAPLEAIWRIARAALSGQKEETTCEGRDSSVGVRWR